MEVKLIYSKADFEMAIKFIARNNSAFLGMTDIIRGRLHESIRRVAKDPDATTLSTMGYILVAERDNEGIDSDQNIVRIDIYVSPALGLDHYTVDDYQEEILT